jgi:hypothetical protein
MTVEELRTQLAFYHPAALVGVDLDLNDDLGDEPRNLEKDTPIIRDGRPVCLLQIGDVISA